MSAEKQPANDVAQIRELIFGDKIREYDRHFAQVEQVLSEIKEALVQKDEQLKDLSKNQLQLKNELNEKLDNAVSELKKLMEELRKDLQHKLNELDESKVNRADLGNFLIELGMRLKGEDLMGKIMEQNSDHGKS